MITIHNLTVKQKLLLDVMWELDSLERVQAFIKTLPPADQRDADSLVKIAVWETIEQEDGLDAYTDIAAAAISSAQRN